MSHGATTAVFATSLPPTEKIVALALADHASPTGENIRPSIKLVARMASVSERTVQRVIRKLCELRIFEEVAPEGRYLAKTYRLLLPVTPMGDKVTPMNRRSRVTPEAAMGDKTPPVMGDIGASGMGDTATAPEPTPVVTTEPTPERTTEPTPTTTAAASHAAERGNGRRVLPTGKNGHVLPPTAPTAPLWDAYAGAYEHRYQVKPVRNAMVLGQMARLLGRLGARESPDVAAFYVGSNTALYVRAGHPVSLLLRDCEKLRTEWATGKRVTDQAARDLDERQARASVWGDMLDEAAAREARRGGV